MLELKKMYDLMKLRLNQVGNTSSRKNTEVKQLGTRLALVWVTIQGLDVDAVATNTVKSQKRKNVAKMMYDLMKLLNLFSMISLSLVASLRASSSSIRIGSFRSMSANSWLLKRTVQRDFRPPYFSSFKQKGGV